MTATPAMLTASAYSVRRSAGSLSQKTPTSTIHIGAVYWRKTALAAEPMVMAVTYRAFMAAKQTAVPSMAGRNDRSARRSSGSSASPAKKARPKAICKGSRVG